MLLVLHEADNGSGELKNSVCVVCGGNDLTSEGSSLCLLS